MQLINAMVALRGDRYNILPKHGLTPAEVLLLQQLHGADAVMQIEPVGEVDRQPYEEVERLKALYPLQQKRVQDIWRDWPADRFPTRIEQLGLSANMLAPAEAVQRTQLVSAKVV